MILKLLFGGFSSSHLAHVLQDSELTVVPDVYTRNHGFQQEAPYIFTSF